MAYSLSFSPEFYMDETAPYNTVPSNRPTNVYQAIISLPLREKVAVAREVLQSPHPILYVQSESFGWDVLDKIRETNTCGDLCSPVDVWIDPEGWHAVDVYDLEGTES